MDETQFRVYFGDGPNRVEWPGFIKWSAAAPVAPGGALARGVPAASEDNIITVKRIADETAAVGFWSWGRTANGQFARKDLTIEVVSSRYEQKVLKRFELKQAWPSKYVGATLDATSNEVAVETIELSCEGLEIR